MSLFQTDFEQSQLTGQDLETGGLAGHEKRNTLALSYNSWTSNYLEYDAEADGKEDKEDRRGGSSVLVKTMRATPFDGLFLGHAGYRAMNGTTLGESASTPFGNGSEVSTEIE